MLGLLVMAMVMLALIGLGWLLVYLRFGPAGLAPAHWTPLCDGVVPFVVGLVVGVPTLFVLWLMGTFAIAIGDEVIASGARWIAAQKAQS